MQSILQFEGRQTSDFNTPKVGFGCLTIALSWDVTLIVVLKNFRSNPTKLKQINSITLVYA